MTPDALERRMILLAMTGRLSDAMLDGSACAWCGSSTEPMEPIYGSATSTSSQLFVCIYHGEEHDYPERIRR